MVMGILVGRVWNIIAMAVLLQSPVIFEYIWFATSHAFWGVEMEGLYSGVLSVGPKCNVHGWEKYLN